MALSKKSVGVSLLAVGCTLRHLVDKVACQQVVDGMADVLTPTQLGFGCKTTLSLLFMLLSISYQT